MGDLIPQAKLPGKMPGRILIHLPAGPQPIKHGRLILEDLRQIQIEQFWAGHSSFFQDGLGNFLKL